MRGDGSLAYDLNVSRGRVRGRVVLSLRSAERKPICELDLYGCTLGAPPPLMGRYMRSFEGGDSGFFQPPRPFYLIGGSSL